MSKLRCTLAAIFPVFIVPILLFFGNCYAQDIDATIKVESVSPPVVSVRGRYLNSERRDLSLLREYAGIGDLAERFTDVVAADSDGRAIGLKKLQPGEYLSAEGFADWSYTVDLQARKPPQAAAHVSWLSKDVGLIMLDDILPQLGGKASNGNIRFDLPEGWNITSAYKQTRGSYTVDNLERAVFVVGTGFREQSIELAGTELTFFISGTWQFTGDEMVEMTRDIYGRYRKLFGTDPTPRAQINLLKFPVSVSHGTWEADTRGSTVTIVSADMPFKTQALQRLHEQLRHEIFHLWVPNALNLSGNYDWFYEGFALYQSLKSGVAANRIRFEDFLDTLSRAHSIDSMQSQRMSLIDASKRRWNGANTQVYARGMLAAFLCDIALIQASKGKRSVEDIFRKLYTDNGLAQPRQDGNTAVLSLLSSFDELRPTVERYIRGSEKVVWRSELLAAGIESTEENFITKLGVVDKPAGRQKDLLDRLGYNNWRKLTPGSK